MRKNKYGVAPKEQRTSRDGIVFHSKGEMQRYEQLLLWVVAKEIRNLRRQVKFPLIINGVQVGFYTADFVYEVKRTQVVWGSNQTEEIWREVVEDFKGMSTTDAKLRIKLFEACTGKTVTISKAKSRPVKKWRGKRG